MKTTEAVTSGVSSSRLTGWRPAWEGWSAAAGFAAAGTTAAMVPGWWGAGLASVLALMGVVRTAEALRTASRRIPLAGFAPAFIHAGDLIRILREKGMDEKKAVDPVRKTARERLVARYEAGRIALLDSMRFNAGREGRLVKNLWIGRGFEWTPAHAQALYELAATPVKPVIVPQRIRKALSLPDPLGAGDIGSPIIHGIGATEEDDIVRPLSSLGGGTLIVGTTQAGKGVMLTSLVTQAILRGDPVIVIDPKSSKRLRNAVWKAAEIAGRPAPLEFHPAFPETGVRLDPLGAWTRPTELATRIAAVMPPDSGAFGNFAWMAVNVAVEGLFYVTERPSLLGLRRLLEGGIDPLLKKALPDPSGTQGSTIGRSRSSAWTSATSVRLPPMPASSSPLPSPSGRRPSARRTKGTRTLSWAVSSPSFVTTVNTTRRSRPRYSPFSRCSQAARLPRASRPIRSIPTTSVRS